LRRSI